MAMSELWSGMPGMPGANAHDAEQFAISEFNISVFMGNSEGFRQILWSFGEIILLGKT